MRQKEIAMAMRLAATLLLLGISLIVLLSLASCQKEGIISNESPANSPQRTIKLTSGAYFNNGKRAAAFVDWSLFNCTAGEWVHIYSKIVYTVTQTTPNTFRYEMNYQGATGIGETSGTIYNGMGLEVGVLNTNSAFVGTFIQKFRFVSGKGNSWTFDALTHLTIDSDNNLVVVLEKIDTPCG